MDTHEDPSRPFTMRLPDDLNVALREQAQALERSQGRRGPAHPETVLTKDVTQGARAVEDEDRA